MTTRRPGVGVNRRIGFRGIGGGPASFSAGVAGGRLPATAIYLSTYGLTLADSNTTVAAWAPWGGGLAAALGSFTASARPAYNPTGGAGGRPLITADGTDDTLVSGAFTKGSAWTGGEWGVVGKIVASGTTGDTLLGYTQAATSRFRLDESATATLLRAVTSTGSGASNNSTTAETTTGHWSMDWDAAGTVQNLRLNGAIESTAAPTVASFADGGTWSLGSQTGAASFANMQLQAFHVSTRALAVAERAYLRALLTFYTAIPC